MDVKDYLEACDRLFQDHRDVDLEFRYDYLTAISCALLDADEKLRAKYDKLTNEARKDMFSYFGTSDDNKSHFDYDVVFAKRNSFLLELFRLIDYAKSEELKKIIQAQVDFARVQLHAQQKLFDVIISFVPLRTLKFDDVGAGNKYARAVTDRNQTMSALCALQQRL